MQEKPHAAFIGVPALYHGAYEDPKADVELQLARVFLQSQPMAAQIDFLSLAQSFCTPPS